MEDAKQKDINMAMELIAGAGDSRSYCMEAIEDAREGNFEAARANVKQAGQAMVNTHEVQTDLIRDEISGESTSSVSLLMVHAQDHLNLALVMRDVAEELITIYERLKKLEGE